jgi:hypothetical protein
VLLEPGLIVIMVYSFMIYTFLSAQEALYSLCLNAKQSDIVICDHLVHAS